MQRPYLLLSLCSLFWAGNIVLGRFVSSSFPPMALSLLALGAGLPGHPALCLAGPSGGLARDSAGTCRCSAFLSLTGLAGYNALGLPRAAVDAGPERPADPVIRPSVCCVVVAAPARGSDHVVAGGRHRDLAHGRAHHPVARRSSCFGFYSPEYRGPFLHPGIDHFRPLLCAEHQAAENKSSGLLLLHVRLWCPAPDSRRGHRSRFRQDARCYAR